MLCCAFAAVGGFIAWLYGGWSADLTTLVIFMTADYITGVFVAVCGKSEKSENGALSSKAGFMGLCKKAVILLMVLVAHRLDVSTGQSFIKTAVVIGFCVNECVSVVENAALLGIPLPDAVKRGIDILKGVNHDNK